MIQITKGNLIATEAEALVNTVNCVGFMGKGIALQFKKFSPENFRAYEKACRKKEVQPGSMFVFETGSLINPKFIINFPTKQHWRGKSKMKDIDSGLKALVGEIKKRNIRSIAIPPLGCGLGGLNWREVQPKIESAMAELPEVEVFLFEPAGAPKAKDMLIGTEKPKMTASRALFIKLIQQYGEMAYRLTLLEIQKLGYFLQEAGEGLRLRYEKGIYGPYADNLNKVLEVMEGHFTQGYGDSQKPDEEIELIPGAIKIADEFLTSHPSSKPRLNKVSELIEGFETPYGMELLSSVHWISKHSETPARNAEDAVNAIHKWNDRKQKMFKEKHIHIAWGRLVEEGWITGTSQKVH